MPTYTCESIRDQWKSRAESLTAFVSQHLVNRTDAYGNYRSVDDRTAGTARTIKSTLTSHTIQRHFMADDRGDLIGLHTTSPENTCRWLVVDIDHHGESDPDAECRNEDAAIAITDKLENQGITSLLMRSNGRGGYHLWLIFNAPVETATVYQLGQWIVEDWQELWLDEKPEVFPKQEQLAEGKLGNWVRLPGLHHTYDFFTEVRDGEKWLSGQAAVDRIRDHESVPAELVESVEVAPVTDEVVPQVKTQLSRVSEFPAAPFSRLPRYDHHGSAITARQSHHCRCG